MDGQLYVVPELTTTFQQWVNGAENFIGNKIFPEVLVDNERFIVWDGGKKHLIIPTNTLRYGKSKANESSFSRSTSEKGPLQEHALSAFITEREYKLGGSALSVENQTVEGLASQMELVDEKALADTIASTSVVTHYTALTGGDKWDDYGNSDPFADITEGVRQQGLYSPMSPNTAWTSWAVWLQMINHPAFLDRIKWSDRGVMTEQDFLTLLAPYGITKLHIGKVKYNTANEGASPVLADVWGKHFSLGYVTDTPGVKEINGGYKFRLRDMRRVTKEISQNPPGAEVVNTDFYDHILLSADVYYNILNVVS